MMSFGSYVAGATEISVVGDSKIKVHRIVAATDPGYAVNPAQIERQIAGSFVYGLTGLFYGGCTVKDGAIEQTNFDTYQMLRLNEAPVIEVHIVQSAEPPGGMGETGTSGIVPAISNAIFAATGKRLRKMPIDPALLKQT